MIEVKVKKSRISIQRYSSVFKSTCRICSGQMIRHWSTNRSLWLISHPTWACSSPSHRSRQSSSTHKTTKEAGFQRQKFKPRWTQKSSSTFKTLSSLWAIKSSWWTSRLNRSKEHCLTRIRKLTDSKGVRISAVISNPPKGSRMPNRKRNSVIHRRHLKSWISRSRDKRKAHRHLCLSWLRCNTVFSWIKDILT